MQLIQRKAKVRIGKNREIRDRCYTSKLDSEIRSKKKIVPFILLVFSCNIINSFFL